MRKSSLNRSRDQLEDLSVELWTWKAMESSFDAGRQGHLSAKQRATIGTSDFYCAESDELRAVIRSECRRLHQAIAVCLEPVWIHIAEECGKPLRSLLADRPRALRQCCSYLVPLFALRCDSRAGAALARQCLSELPNGFPSAWSKGFCVAGGTRLASPRVDQAKRLLSVANVELVDSLLKKRGEPILDLNGKQWMHFSRALLKERRLERRLARKHFVCVASRRAPGGGPMFSWCVVPPHKFSSLRDKFNNCVANGNYESRHNMNTLRVMAVYAQGHPVPVGMVSATWSEGAWRKSEAATRMPSELREFTTFAQGLPPRFSFAKQALLFNQSIPPRDRALRRSALQEFLCEDAQFGYVFVGKPRRTLSECDELRLSTCYGFLQKFLVVCESRFRSRYSGVVHVDAGDRCFAQSIIRFLNQLPLSVPDANAMSFDVMLGAADLSVALTRALRADRLNARAEAAQFEANDVPRVLSNGESSPAHWSESVIAHEPARTVGDLSRSYDPKLLVSE